MRYTHGRKTVTESVSALVTTMFVSCPWLCLGLKIKKKIVGFFIFVFLVFPHKRQIYKVEKYYPQW